MVGLCGLVCAVAAVLFGVLRARFGVLRVRWEKAVEWINPLGGMDEPVEPFTSIAELTIINAAYTPMLYTHCYIRLSLARRGGRGKRRRYDGGECGGSAYAK
jgi:hypothetical protein